MSLKLSIVIPVFKVEQYLEQCLQSIYDVQEDRTDFEVILVNDGSPDRSIDIARRYAQKHSSMRILEQENQGLSAARMNGLALARGEFVWFVDSDDFLLPGGLEKVLSLLKDDQETDVFVSPLLWYYQDKEKNHLDIPDGICGTTDSGKSFLRNQSFFCWAAQRYIIRRQLFSNSFLYFPKGLLHEDEYFGKVVLYLARTVLILEKPVYAYRQRPGSIIHEKGIRSCYDLLDIYGLLRDFFEKQVSENDQEWFGVVMVSVLRDSFRASLYNFQSPEFQSFVKDKRPYVLSEYRHFSKSVSLKTRIKDVLLFRYPILAQSFITFRDKLLS